MLSNDEFAIFCTVVHPDGKCCMPVSFDDCGVPSNRDMGVEVIDCMTGENLGIKNGGMTIEIKYNEFRMYRCKIVDLK